jgi:hypothetical protein
MANDVENFIDQHHLQKAVLIGHSMCVSSTLEALGERKKTVISEQLIKV